MADVFAAPPDLDRKLLQLQDDAALSALRRETAEARKARFDAGWPGVIGTLEDEATRIVVRAALDGERFDRALADFVARELRQLAAEIRLNLNLQKVPQWPK